MSVFYLLVCSAFAPAAARADQPAIGGKNTVFSASTALDSIATSPTPDTTPTPTPEATPTAVFARSASWGVQLYLPAQPSDLLAVGFHQADPSKRTLALAPAGTCLRIYNPVRTKRLLKATPTLKLFQQALRGRGGSNFSAADCAVKPKSTILAPVSGTVTSVKTYWLYGRYRDVRLEILPDGASRKLRVVVLHIQNPQVTVGQHVVGGVTPVATVRHFRFESAVNRYLPVKYADHAHVQINRK
jgi:hypothetical protein